MTEGAPPGGIAFDDELAGDYSGGHSTVKAAPRPDPLRAPTPGGAEKLAVFLLLLAHALLALAGIRVHSVTYDERSHLPAGMAAAATGEIALNRQHPPLVKLLAGLAANTADPVLPLQGDAYRQGREWDFGDEVLFHAGNDHWKLLRRGRLPTLAISLLGGLFVYLWSRRLFGGAGGLLALALWTFSPTLLGHDGWVTMDAPLAAFASGALYYAWRARAPGGGRREALLAGLLLGLALATKFSGLVFAAALLPLALWPAGGALGSALGSALGNALGNAFGRRILPLFLAAAATLWACYFFPFDPLFYLRDLARLYQDLKPDYLFYLAGDFERRFPHYFVATFALKSTPVELLAVPLIGFAVWHERRRGELLAFLAWPGLLFFVATSALATNQGHRYLLPCYPLLFVLAGSLPSFLAPRLRRAGLLVALLAAAQAFEAWTHQPDHLSYFNIFAGGPRSGPHWLDDSNVDWDQDLGRLPGWLAARGIGPVRGAFLGRVDPRFYGLAWEPVAIADVRDAPRPGAYVMSGHVLARLLEKAEKEGWHSDWLHRYQPDDALGGSLFLYVFPAPGAAGPAGEKAEPPAP